MAWELVSYIQETYPPTDYFPRRPDPSEVGDSQVDHTAGASTSNVQPGIDRAPLPEWLSPGQGELIKGDAIPSLNGRLAPNRMPVVGPDVLAYYLPFHFYRSWGIYVRTSGVVEVASMLLAAAPSREGADCVNLAYQVLIEHERFHCLTELACSRAEIAARTARYNAYFLDREAALLEEALANARAVRVALKDQPTEPRVAVHEWMRSLGPGYREFRQWVANSAFKKGKNSLGSLMIRPGISTGAFGPTEFLYEGLKLADVPVYLVHDDGVIGTVRPFPKAKGIRIVVHTNDHRPEHVHLQTAEGRDITRLLWPSLEPLDGDATLSSRQKDNVRNYVKTYGDDIEDKVRRVYGVKSG